MDKIIIHPMPDGGVNIIFPAPQARQKILVSPEVTQEVVIPATNNDPERTEIVVVEQAVYRDQTDEEFLEYVIALSHIPEGVPIKIIDRADLPTDHEFRNAWEWQA